MIIEINKDIDKYQESVIMGMTAKQLIFSAASVAVGGTIILAMHDYIGLTASAYLAVPCVAPIAMSGYFSYNDMDFMEYMKRKIYFAFFNRAITYRSTECEEAVRNEIHKE